MCTDDAEHEAVAVQAEQQRVVHDVQRGQEARVALQPAPQHRAHVPPHEQRPLPPHCSHHTSLLTIILIRFYYVRNSIDIVKILGTVVYGLHEPIVVYDDLCPTAEVIMTVKVKVMLIHNSEIITFLPHSRDAIYSQTEWCDL